jgi:hypothetical protein
VREVIKGMDRDKAPARMGSLQLSIKIVGKWLRGTSWRSSLTFILKVNL